MEVNKEGVIAKEEETSIWSSFTSFFTGFSSEGVEEKRVRKAKRKEAQAAYVPANAKKELTHAQKAALAKLKSSK